ncbi:ROK family protein [Streptomyces sp. Amel2xC10]|uniref:ROK family protein n=1 Tax=Streptomyces sp. Amel2xC10 TaxID=1305826 RepID=UPI000A08D47D|nr:ROK family protein [Streptomyces sp. Amel2xC10]SMF78923.1 glucokinase [Streptomyces sp. Amel2xC10]
MYEVVRKNLGEPAPRRGDTTESRSRRRPPAASRRLASASRPTEPATVIALALAPGHIAGAVVCEDEALTVTHRTVGPSVGIDEFVDLALDRTTELRLHAERLGRSPTAAGVVLAEDGGGATGIGPFAGEYHWRGAPVRAWLEEHLDLPVTVGHDMRAGAQAEACLGAGRGSRAFLYVPAGDRIPAVLVLDGQAPAKSRFCVGDLGRLPTWTRAAETGRAEPVEDVAAPAALTRRYTAAGGKAAPSALSVHRRAQEGDRAATRVWNEALEAFADALASAVLLLNPERVVVGGDFAEADKAYFRRLRRAVAQRTEARPAPVIVPAQLGLRAALLGAALLTRWAPTGMDPLSGPPFLTAVPAPPTYR